MVGHARGLGAHLAVSNRAYAATLRTRLKTSTVMVRKIGRLPIKFKNKAHSIRTKAMAKGLYGCEASLLHPADQMAFTTAIKQAISKTATHKSADLTFATSSHGCDLDPETTVLTRRVTMLRRMLVKRPRRQTQAIRILQEYIDADFTGTRTDQIMNGTATIASLPGHPGRHQWKPYFRPFGTIGVLLVQLHEKAAALTMDLDIISTDATSINIMNCPLQELKPMLHGLATRARTYAAEGSRREVEDLFEIDAKATTSIYSKLEENEANFLWIVQQGAAWSKESIANTGHTDEMQCDLCGAPKHTIQHVIWTCPVLHRQRQEANPKLASPQLDALPQPVQIGVAPAMCIFPCKPYWGNTKHDEPLDLTAEHGAYVGMTDDIITHRDDGTIKHNEISEAATATISQLAEE